MTAPEGDAPVPTADPTAPLLRVRDVAITHEGEDAPTPASVSFEVAPGEVVLLLGPSGSGKSTLTLALNGLIPHDLPAEVSGTVEVGGLAASDSSVAELSTRVAMVFQDPDAQLVTGTLLDEVAFGPENLRMPVAEVLARAEAALRRVGLWERRTENPDRLSGGGRQRLALACALAMGSPLLVLDEPTANLDPQGIEEVYAALAEVVAAGDRAVVLVEHNLDAAIGVVDRAVVIDHDGRLVVDGTVDEVLRERAAELHDLGVWLPTSALAALRLRAAGWRMRPLPLSPAELHAALEGEAAPVASHEPAGSHGPRRMAPTSEDSPPILRSTRDSPKDAAGGARRANSEATDPRRANYAVGDARRVIPDTGGGSGEPLIRVRALTLRRGRAEVLHGIDLDIPRGSFTAIVGANGAGKTSLVQAMAGVIPPPRGTVFIDGLDVGRADVQSLTARIGFVFQNPEHQFIAHTVFDELAHGLRLRRLPDDDVRERTERMLHRFGLAAKARTHPFLLSGGQKRRLSVGTALISGAPILALDEPTFGQDRARADELLDLLDELRAEGTTIIVVTHDMQLVTEHADRTVLLDGGRVRAAAPTAEVFADRAQIEAAGLRLPPLRLALEGVARHPELSGVTRLADLPGSAR